MNAPSVDIKDMLESESSLGLTFVDNLFIGKDPIEPKDAVIILDSFGHPHLTLDGQDENPYESKSVQIRVRSISYTTGWNLAHDIMLSLHGRAQETWNGTLYTVIYCSSGPALLDWDDNGLVRFIINFNVQRR